MGLPLTGITTGATFAIVAGSSVKVEREASNRDFMAVVGDEGFVGGVTLIGGRDFWEAERLLRLEDVILLVEEIKGDRSEMIAVVRGVLFEVTRPRMEFEGPVN